MNVAIFVWFLFGIIAGYLYFISFGAAPSKSDHFSQYNEVINSKPNINYDVEKVKRIRILCFLHTMPKMHSLRAVHIRQTFGKHCDKLLFSSTLTDMNLGAVGFNVVDDHNHMWGKVKLMMQHIHKNFINDYDWFIKGDDDMFLITENLKFLLAEYSTDDPIYFGYKFNYTTLYKRGYFSGGSGYVMSRRTVRIFVEEVLTNRSGLTKCKLKTDNRVEDMEITACLDNYNVYAGDGRDLLKRERFIMHPPERVLHDSPNNKNWYWSRKYYWTDEGLDCCSNYTISFHYIKPKYQYTLYYLTYRLQPFGIRRHFPPPPNRRDFVAVANILDFERKNKTLRGY